MSVWVSDESEEGFHVWLSVIAEGDTLDGGETLGFLHSDGYLERQWVCGENACIYGKENTKFSHNHELNKVTVDKEPADSEEIRFKFKLTL